MNATWFNELTNFIDSIRKNACVTLKMEQVGGLLSSKEVLSSLESIPDSHLKSELIQFYTEYAGSCEITYTLDTRGLAVRTKYFAEAPHFSFPSSLRGGMQIHSPEDLVEMRMECSELADWLLSISDIDPDGKLYAGMLSDCIPLWRNDLGEIIAGIAGNENGSDGIYSLSSDGCIRIADGLEGWLNYLKEHYYLGYGLSELSIFLAGENLVHANEILSCLKSRLQL